MNIKTRMLVCGGRDFGNVQRDKAGRPIKDERYDQLMFISYTLDRIAEEISTEYNPDDNWLPSDILVISGGAKGVDKAAIGWATVNWLQFEEYEADWEKYGKAAGYIRNAQMLEEGKPDLVVAFPGGKGTAMMVDIAKKAGVPVREITYEA